MQSVFVFVALFISVSQAGVGVLSPQDEANALQLFHSMCAQGGGGGDYGEYRVWCKSSGQDYQEEVLTHQVHVPQGAATPGQIVFVQAPPISYRHNIQLSGAPGGQQSSKIYVLPQKATHSIEATYRPGGNPGSAKPQVFFLNKNFAGQNQQASYGPPPPSSQEVQYGPPLAVAPPPPQAQYGVVDVGPNQPEYQPIQQEYGYPQHHLPSQSGPILGGYPA